MEPAIRTDGLTKRFGAVVAVGALDLRVERGTVFGLLGPNGAGKTTTIRLLMGALRPSEGTARVAGYDPWTQRTSVHRRVGYLPGDFIAYGSLSAHDYLTYLGNLRGGVEHVSIDLFAKRLDLDLLRPIRELSHGNRQKVGIIQAFMHVPDVLILDEPTSGLDPLMQQEFVLMVREARDAGQTVFLSSHMLDEVEAVADTVGMLRGGMLLVEEDVATLKRKALRHISMTFEGAVPFDALRGAPGVDRVEVTGPVATVFVTGSTAALLRAAAPHGIVSIISREPDLEDIFLSYYGSAG